MFPILYFVSATCLHALPLTKSVELGFSAPEKPLGKQSIAASLTLDGDGGAALLLAHGVGGEGGVAAGVGRLHLVDGDLIAAVRREVAVHADAVVLHQLDAVLEA